MSEKQTAFDFRGRPGNRQNASLPGLVAVTHQRQDAMVQGDVPEGDFLGVQSEPGQFCGVEKRRQPLRPVVVGVPAMQALEGLVVQEAASEAALFQEECEPGEHPVLKTVVRGINNEYRGESIPPVEVETGRILACGGRHQYGLQGSRGRICRNPCRRNKKRNEGEKQKQEAHLRSQYRHKNAPVQPCGV